MDATTIAAIIMAFAVGIALGVWLAVLTEKPTVELKLDKELLGSITSQMVMAWLDSRGLVWMPKGGDFRQKVKR